MCTAAGQGKHRGHSAAGAAALRLSSRPRLAGRLRVPRRRRGVAQDTDARPGGIHTSSARCRWRRAVAAAMRCSRGRDAARRRPRASSARRRRARTRCTTARSWAARIRAAADYMTAGPRGSRARTVRGRSGGARRRAWVPAAEARARGRCRRRATTRLQAGDPPPRCCARRRASTRPRASDVARDGARCRATYLMGADARRQRCGYCPPPSACIRWVPAPSSSGLRCTARRRRRATASMQAGAPPPAVVSAAAVPVREGAPGGERGDAPELWCPPPPPGPRHV